VNDEYERGFPIQGTPVWIHNTRTGKWRYAVSDVNGDSREVDAAMLGVAVDLFVVALLCILGIVMFCEGSGVC